MAVTSKTLMTYKHWKVETVQFDDGAYACVASVQNDSGSESFSIWASAQHELQLQFYSSNWQFGNDDTADLNVEIDQRGPWSLTEAELSENSVFFTLPGSDGAVNFLTEIAGGSILYLRSASGQDVQSYSLFGSNASMNALIDCGNAISGTADKNPFN